MKKVKRITDIAFEDIKNQKFIGVHKKNIILVRIMNSFMILLAISLAFAGINVVAFRNQKFFEGNLGHWTAIVMALAMIGYMTAMVIARYWPEKNWLCPGCFKDLPYYTPVGKRPSKTLKRVYAMTEEQNIKLFHVKGSSLIIPEKCPHCGKTLHW